MIVRSNQDWYAWWDALREQGDPLSAIRQLWPDVLLYDKQIEILESVWHNDETYVPAGNMLGKDFIAGLIIVLYPLMNYPCKVVTTSTNDKHLDTLWGEADRFLRECRQPLLVQDGGCIVYSHRRMGFRFNGVDEKDSYVSGRVATNESKGEGLSGHHQKHTLFVCDEASGAPDIAYKMAQGWAKRMLIIGNPNPCTNFFFRGVKGGDILAQSEE